MSRTKVQSLDLANADLLEALYAAATDPTRWPDFIDRVSDCFQSQATIFLRPGDDPDRTRLIAGNQDPESLRAHNEYYVRLIPWSPHVGRAHPVLDLSEARVPTNEYLKTEYYNDWMKPQGLMHWAGVRPTYGDDNCLGLGVCRSAQRGTFSQEEQRLLIAMSGHLQRAGEITQRLALFDAQTRATSGVLGDLEAGVVLVDAELRVQFANRVAEDLLLAGEGLCVRGGRLRGHGSVLDAKLREAVERATRPARDAKGPGSTLAMPRGDGAPPLTLTIAPLDERDRPGFTPGPLAVIVIGAPERDVDVDPEKLRAAYDLTQAESRLAAALCAGRTPAEHATDAGVSLNTVKFHLKGVYDKTGETRQPALVRRLIANPALRRPAETKIFVPGK